jgi:hypothetical protein
MHLPEINVDYEKVRRILILMIIILSINVLGGLAISTVCCVGLNCMFRPIPDYREETQR